jgi:hypothetical protein
MKKKLSLSFAWARMMRQASILGIYTSFISIGFATTARAATDISVELPYNNFINMGATQPLANDMGKCVATATMNSFVYLYNSFPSVYGVTKLITGSNPSNSLSDARDELDGPSFMNGVGCGVSVKDAWEGKLKWIDTYAPGTTLFSGMSAFSFAGWYGEEYLLSGYPTFDFLFNQLRDKEDVELRIDFVDNGVPGAHSVTLSSLHFTDTDMDNTWDPGLESAQIDYIDPNCPSGTLGSPQGPTVVPLLYDTISGSLQFDWQNGDGVKCNPGSQKYRSTITYAYAESVPSPLAFLGVATALHYSRRMRSRIKLGCQIGSN